MAKRKKKRIAVLCGGGDCPGLNAVIRAVVKTCILRYQSDVFGSEDSFDGFLKPDRIRPLTLDSVRGILPRGGTILGTTNKGNPFRYPRLAPDGTTIHEDLSGRVVERFHELGFDALVAIGGDGTLTIAQRLIDLGLPIVGVPKTIDNDLSATELTFGFDSAVVTATEAIDKIHTTAESHDRVMVVEVMGRNAGWIALEAGVAGGADIILIPEIPFRMESVCAKLRDREARGRSFSVIVVAEGATLVGGEQVFQQTSGPRRLGGLGFDVAALVEKQFGKECRVVVLGHLQRGGSPSAFDRLLATRFGVAAAAMASRGHFGRMVCLKCGRIESVPIREAIARQKQVGREDQRVHAAKAIGISFGD